MNLLAEIKNAQAVKKESLKIIYSKKAEKILEILVAAKYIEKFEKKGRGVKKALAIYPKYPNGRPAISGARLISKPSRRIYLGYREIRPVKSGYGLLVVSTPQGIMTGQAARKKKLGGEALFEIW